MARPIAPPRASISRTKCPLPMPPMAGLQLIWAMVSRLCVIRAVRTPILADAKAASTPACPAPMIRMLYICTHHFTRNSELQSKNRTRCSRIVFRFRFFIIGVMLYFIYTGTTS